MLANYKFISVLRRLVWNSGRICVLFLDLWIILKLIIVEFSTSKNFSLPVTSYDEFVPTSNKLKFPKEKGPGQFVYCTSLHRVDPDLYRMFHYISTCSLITSYIYLTYFGDDEYFQSSIFSMTLWSLLHTVWRYLLCLSKL